jgi:hypothetical protein
MTHGADTVIIDIINFFLGRIITTAMEMSWVVKPRVSEEQEGGFRS